MTGPNEPAGRWMSDSGSGVSAGGNWDFKVGRNLRNKGAARLLLQRSSGQDYISTGSGDQRNQVIQAILHLQLKVLLKYQMRGITWSRSRPVLLSLGTTLTSEVVAGYMGYGCREEQEMRMVNRLKGGGGNIQ